MSQLVTVYDLLLSCPSDVAEYIELIERAINRFNNIYGRNNNVIIRTRYWANDSYSELGKPPQEIINSQIVDNSDISVAVFWTRFGTPTESYGSGTEEEIERMISMGKQIFLYFMDKPLHPSKFDHGQYKKLQLFIEKHKNDGIYFLVQDETALANKFRENLELYFESILHGTEFKKMSGKKEILWVDDRPENNVYERNILDNYGLSFSLALSTQQALQLMEHRNYSLIISDMGRKEGADEGYVLLKKVRERDKTIPFIIYAGSNRSEHIKLTLERGGQGCTNNASDLIDMVLKNLLKC
jgi:CheY-like chemotaxis protein